LTQWISLLKVAFLTNGNYDVLQLFILVVLIFWKETKWKTRLPQTTQLIWGDQKTFNSICETT